MQARYVKSGSLGSNMAVKGSLKRHIAWWKNNISNEYILNIIENGYKLPLLSMPKEEFLKNNLSARQEPSFVSEEILKLLATGVLIEQKTPPLVVNPFTVAKNAANKMRLVLDLRTVNPLLAITKYKYEDISVVSEYLEKNCFLCVFDLKSGYHHIDIDIADQTFLGCSWEGKYYTYSALPFGLAVAGLVFSKVLKELVKKWRAEGIKIVLYLDDGILVADNLAEATRHSSIIQADLSNAGFIVNQEKSVWVPSKRLKWLGFVLDTDKNTFEVPQDKLLRLRISINNALAINQFCSARCLAKVVGKITSLFHALGNVVYILTKNCQCWIADRSSWGSKSRLPEVVIQELVFWYENLYQLDNMPLEKPFFKSDIVIYSDASATGAGAFILDSPGFELVEFWNKEEAVKSSTWREIRTVTIFLGVHKQFLKNRNVSWFTDNQAVPRIIFKGSMKNDLQTEALSIFNLCLENNINLSISWIPRDSNEEADQLSKVHDRDDWQISSHIFNFLNRSEGPFTCDCFASNISKKYKKCYAKYWCSNVAGINGLAYSWEGETVWLVPPPKLIIQTIGHCRVCKAVGILIIPKLLSASFWPVVLDYLKDDTHL